MSFRITIVAHTTGIHVNAHDTEARGIVSEFSKKLVVWEEKYIPGRGKVTVRKYTFATYNSRTRVYGFHRNMMDEFIKYLTANGIKAESIRIEIVNTLPGVEGSLMVAKGVQPKEKQVPVIDFVMLPTPRRVLPLQMGFGKTFLALYCSCLYNQRTAVIMGAMHIETWIKDSKWIFDTHPENIRVIQGGVKLKKLFKDAKEGNLHSSILIFSVNTIRDYLKEYEKSGKSGYGVDPIDFYKVLGVGFRISDEVHENLHFNFIHDIEMDPPKSLLLSATIDSDEAFTDYLYKTIYPIRDRYLAAPWIKYINCIALAYQLEEPEEVKCIGAKGTYSHHVFEEWILESDKRRLHYYDFITNIFRAGFFEKYMDGMKCLILFSSVKMCHDYANYLRDKYPQFSISDYTGDHETEVLHTNDVVCSTIGSSGTGKDIKGLRTTIMTVGLGKREKNLQVLGRLREIDQEKYPGVEPDFYYLVCKDIGAHVKYHEMKKKFFYGVVKTFKAINLFYRI